MKRVAILLPSLKFGGAERVSLNLAKEMKSLGFIIDILVMSKEGEFLLEAKRNFDVYDLRCNRTYKLPFRLIEYIWINRPNVIISNFLKLSLCACISRIFFPFFKLILWEHAPPSMGKGFSRFIYSLSASLFYQLSNKVVAVSHGLADDIVSCTYGLKRKIVTIYNPILPPDDSIMKQLVVNNSNKFKIISVGRLESDKNPELLIEAFSLLVDELDVTLLIVGDGSQRQKLEQICIELKIQTRVRFFGFSAEPYQLLIMSDLLVLPSNFEGFGNVIVEAMYCGLPIVSTDCPCGPRELLMDGEYGSLVPVNDKAKMAQAILHELRNRRSPEIQKFAAQRFLPPVVVKQFLDLM